MRRIALLFLPAAMVACAYANGYDPARYAGPQAVASVDPEIEPLPPSPKRLIIDPRGSAVVKAPPVASAPALPRPVLADVPDAAPPAMCGASRADLCPMQRFMHSEMATAHTAGTLTSAFTLLAGMSPDDAWGWTAIATRGAELANAGNLVAAKAQCAACHDVYQPSYRLLYRAKPL